MTEYEYIREEVRKFLKESRFKHSLGVEKEAVKLSRIYGEDTEKCRIAAIAHDIAKHYSDNELIELSKMYGIEIDEIQFNSPQLLHGPVGALYCKDKLGLLNEDVFRAIYYHTTGRANMSLLEKIIYLADMTEEGRSFPGLNEIRELSYVDLDAALILSCNSTISFVMKNNLLIHPFTIELRNGLLLKEDFYGKAK